MTTRAAESDDDPTKLHDEQLISQRSRSASAVTTPVPAPPAPRDVSGMDDFEVIGERQRIAATLAALTDRYRTLNREISTRDTLKWMLAP